MSVQETLIVEENGNDIADRAVREWIEANIGPVQAFERQPRWRPGWNAKALLNGEIKALYVRGSRGGYWPPMPLSFEAKVQEYFHRSGVRVARIYGFIDAADAYVMEMVPGVSDLGKAEFAHLEPVRRQLVEQMARMHSIDPGPLLEFGLPPVTSNLDLTTGYLQAIEKIYRATKKRPEPCIEFILGWLKRNVPTSACPPAIIAVDAGQFVYSGDRLNAMIDFELACIGDRYTDLGALRTRTRFEALGDLDNIYAYYAEASGIPLDFERIRYHGIGLSMLCPQMVTGTLTEPSEGIDYQEYLTWWAFSLKDALDQLAEIKGLDLEQAALPAPSEGRFAPMFSELDKSISQSATLDDYAAHQKTKQGIVTRTLAQLDRYQGGIEARYIDDIAALTGRRPTSWQEADQSLEDFVLDCGDQHEDALIALFHRHISSLALIMADRADWPNKFNWLTKPMPPISG